MFFTSQFQTCKKIHMDDCTCNHSANKLRTCDQRAATNIPTGKIEHLISCIFILLTFTIGEEEKLISIFPTQNQLEGQIYSHWPFVVVGSNHNKTKKGPEKFIPRWQHHPCLDVAI
jgi:hypothetical protein